MCTPIVYNNIVILIVIYLCVLVGICAAYSYFLFVYSTFYGEIRCGPLGDAGKEGRRVRVTALIGDSQAAMLGEGCLSVGDAKLTLGTGAFLNVNTGFHVIPPNTGKRHSGSCEDQPISRFLDRMHIPTV